MILQRSTVMLRLALATLSVCVVVSQVHAAQVLVEERFENGAARWKPTDPKAWRIGRGPEGAVYSLFQQSKYAPPHRSPINFALLDGVKVSDFDLEVSVLSTIKDYGHRDVILVFGYQDPAHFYYTHLAKQADRNANQIFIVNGADRAKISTKTSSGTPWDDAWHKLKVTRRTGDGKIAVYFDDLKSPIMEATDTTFKTGLIGIGSFDDTADFDNLKLEVPND